MDLPSDGSLRACFVQPLLSRRRKSTPALACPQSPHELLDAGQELKVREYVAKWGHRIVLHFLPTYDPQSYPIERIWWHLHEGITRNHRCRNIDELLNLVVDWLGAAPYFAIETSVYTAAPAA